MWKAFALFLVLVVSIVIIRPSSPECSENGPPEKYALFICGTTTCSCGGVCPSSKEDSVGVLGPGVFSFWADIVSFTNQLTDEYCYEPDHIYIRYGDGDYPPLPCEYYELSADIDSINFGPCTRDSVLLAFEDIQERADSNDVLLVYINGHGACWDNAVGHASICLFFDCLDDYELGDFIDSVQCVDKTVIANTCFCGGLIDEVVAGGGLILTANNYRVAHGADNIGPEPDCDDPGGDAGDPAEIDWCGKWTIHHPEHTYHLLNALRGKTVAYQNPVPADSNDDGWITFDEAHAWACSTNSFGDCDGNKACYSTNLETPQMDWPAGLSPSRLCLGGRIDLASGTLCKNTTYWSGTVTVTGDVIVPSGQTLVVKPGTVVKCDSLDDRAGGDDTTDVEIIVYGTLSAVGTADSTIKFTSRADPPPGQIGEYANDIWRGIRFEPGSSGDLEYVTVRRAYFAVDCDSASPSIKHASICDNQIAGIRCTGNAAPTIASGDSIARSYQGIVCKGTSAPVIKEGVVVDTCNVGIQTMGSSTPTIRDCRVKRCQKGISVAGDSDPEIQSGCDLYNSHQVGLYFNSNGVSTITVDSVKVRDNYAYGIRCDNGTMVTVSNSEVYGNDDGVAAFDSTECLLGRASPAAAGDNNLYSNSVCNVRNATTGGDTLFAENCWWGADPPDTSKICGVVDYDPWLDSKVQLALKPFVPYHESGLDRIVSLGPVFPVPPRGHATIQYLVRSPGSKVRISIVNVRGQEIGILTDGWKAPGQYTLHWNLTSEAGGALPSGVYFCVLRSDDSAIQAAKLVILGNQKDHGIGGAR